MFKGNKIKVALAACLLGGHVMSASIDIDSFRQQCAQAILSARQAGREMTEGITIPANVDVSTPEKRRAFIAQVLGPAWFSGDLTWTGSGWVTTYGRDIVRILIAVEKKITFRVKTGDMHGHILTSASRLRDCVNQISY